jgi:hypothetical protein
MTKTTVFIFFLASPMVLQAQEVTTYQKQFYKVVISNSHAAKPLGSFASLFYKDFHPGLEIGFENVLKNRKKHQTFLEMRLGYMFHRWVQHNIALSANAGYRYLLTPSWSAEIKIGAGYQHSIPNSKIYKITESDGLQKKRNFGRSQAIGNLGLGVAKTLPPPSSIRILMEYKQQIQTPFIREYVPVLPYNSLLIGVAIPFKRSPLKSKK